MARGVPQRCPFPKHKDRAWEDILKDDPEYLMWLVGMDGPALTPGLEDFLLELLEEDGHI